MDYVWAATTVEWMAGNSAASRVFLTVVRRAVWKVCCLVDGWGYSWVD